MMIFLSFDIALLNDKNREYKENHNAELNDKNKFLETRYPSILFYTRSLAKVIIASLSGLRVQQLS